jgi:peptidoglycan/LPS O-acetylase OafA/YrhL
LPPLRALPHSPVDSTLHSTKALAGHRSDTVDLLRGLCILGVILFHVRILLTIHGVAFGDRLPLLIYDALFNSGVVAVVVFFALSGFLIATTSIRRFGTLRQIVPGAFYRIRFARIAPPLGVVLIVLSALHLGNVGPFHIQQAALGPTLLSILTFTFNWFQAVHGWMPPGWAVLWSLSVEEMFYLFFPLVCLSLRRVWTSALALVCIAAAMEWDPVARWLLPPANEVWASQSYFLNMPVIAAGCLSAVLLERCRREAWLRNSPWPMLLQVAGMVGTGELLVGHQDAPAAAAP